MNLKLKNAKLEADKNAELEARVKLVFINMSKTPETFARVKPAITQ